MNVYSRLTFLFVLVFILSDKTHSKGGRGGGGRGGGGFRSGSGSRYSGSSWSRSGSSSFGSGGGGVRWASFGAGMLAYSAMSRVASGGYYHRGYYGAGAGGYAHRGSDGSYSPNSKVGTGDECVNNEDFNGTKFGKFRCPLPEFDEDATYCCGSAEDETQYCCTFFDDSSRKSGVIFVGVITAAILFYSITYCIRRNASSKRTINRSFMGGQVGQPMRMQPLGPRPMFNQAIPLPPPPSRLPDGSSVPLMSKNNNRPFVPQNNPRAAYPTQPMRMPPPMSMPQPSLSEESNSKPPPSYTEALRIKESHTSPGGPV